MLTTATDIFEGWLGDIKFLDPSYGFLVRVGCVKMAAPRHERFEFLLEMGRPHVDALFNKRPLPEKMTFVFPERYMSVHEQQQFMAAIMRHPEKDNFERVDILTSSPLIIGNFRRESVRILTWEDDAKHNGL